MVKSPAAVGLAIFGLAAAVDQLLLGGWTVITAAGLVAGVLVAGGMLAADVRQRGGGGVCAVADNAAAPTSGQGGVY